MLQQSEMTLATNRYGVYAIPATVAHRPAAQLIQGGKVYEPQTIDFIRNNNRGGHVVHAGTFFGDFLPGLSDGMKSGNMVWAFEPNPVSFHAAQKTIELNHLDNVNLTNAALSDKEGELRMETTRNGQALGGISNINEAGDVTVSAVTIDSMLDGYHVSILQLDLEGHEKPALLGARGTIQRCRPIVILESFTDEAWLSDLGVTYRKAGQLHQNGVFIAV